MNTRSFFKQFVPPQPCTLCGAMSQDGVWCNACAKTLPRFSAAHCPVCALPSPSGAICGQCLQYPPSYQRTVAAYVYAFPIDKLIQAMKFSEALPLVPALADGLLEQITLLPDGIVAMPLHPERIKERGFNQSQLLAQRLAKKLNIPLLDICQRVRNTTPQSTLAWDERRKNLHQAFHCTGEIEGKHIAIVDDVMTTGASMEALASTLLQAGATEISAWAIARTPPH